MPGACGVPAPSQLQSLFGQALEATPRFTIKMFQQPSCALKSCQFAGQLFCATTCSLGQICNRRVDPTASAPCKWLTNNDVVGCQMRESLVSEQKHMSLSGPQATGQVLYHVWLAVPVVHSI